MLISESPMQISGSCHCGAISFTALIDPGRVIACHCADCQQFSGAPFRAVIPTPVENVRLSGVPRHYVKVAESGNRRAQAFCAECGTQLYATEAEAPRVLNLRLGCVAERAMLPPRAQIWCESSMPWLQDLGALPRHAKGTSSPVLASAGGGRGAG
jgi:hypothetical protein